MKHILKVGPNIQRFWKANYPVYRLPTYRTLLIVVVVAALFGIYFSFWQDTLAASPVSTASPTPTKINTVAQGDSQRLANAAETVINTQGSPELATLLAIRAYRDAPAPQIERVLRRALTVNRIVGIFYRSTLLPPDEKLAVVAGELGAQVKSQVKEIATGKIIADLPTGFYLNGFNFAKFTPNGELAIGSIMDDPRGQAIVVNLKTGKIVQHLTDTKKIIPQSISPNGQYVLTTAENPGEIQLWSVATGQLVNTFTLEGRAFWEVIFSPDGKFIYAMDSPPGGGGGGGDDKVNGYHIRVFEAETLKPLRILYPDHYSALAYTLSPDGETIAYLAENGGELQLAQLDTQTGDNAPIGSKSFAYQDSPFSDGRIWWIEYSPDGSYLLLGGEGKIFLLDARNGLLLDTLITAPGRNFGGFSPDGKYVLSTQQDVTQVWQINRPDFPQIYEFADLARQIAESPTNKYLVVVSRGTELDLPTTILLYDTQIGTLLRSITQKQQHAGSYQPTITFSPDELYVVVNLGNSTSFDDTMSSTPIGPADTSPAGTSEPQIFIFGGSVTSPDAHYVLSENGDGNLSLWDMQVHRLVRTIPGTIDYTIGINSFSRDNKYFVINTNSQSENSKIQIWETLTGNLVNSFSIVGYLRGITPNGQFIITRTSTVTREDVLLWDIRTGNLSKIYPDAGDVLAVSQENGYLMTQKLDSSLKLHLSPDATLPNAPDTASSPNAQPAVETIPVQMQAQGGEFNLSRDGHYLSVKYRNPPIVQVWDTQTGELVLSHSFNDDDGLIELDSVALSLDNHYVYASIHSYRLPKKISRVYRLTVLPEYAKQLRQTSSGDLLAYACQHIFRELTAQERFDYAIWTNDATCPNLPQPSAQEIYSTPIPEHYP